MKKGDARTVLKYSYAVRARVPLSQSALDDYTYLRCSNSGMVREDVCAICRKPHDTTLPIICSKCRFRIHPECGELNTQVSESGAVGLVCQRCLGKDSDAR